MGGASAKALQAHVPQVRAHAMADFRTRHTDLRFAPVVVVIAAYDEETSIGGVLEGVRPQACGLGVDILVVDDGSDDRTSEVALAAGAHVVRLERNCGHGVALRTGYRLAREQGARYIVTLDGDGQWDAREVPTVLEPLVEDEADLVLGSRVLGHSEDDQRLRQLGVRVFAGLVRLLTGVAVTDTSTGLRAMRVEVTATVRQEQVQYQTSELLIGAIYQGYRVAERPILHRKRSAGQSKKGHDLLYGLRYARVLLGTWWRERRAARAPAPQEALSGVAGAPRDVESGTARPRLLRMRPALGAIGFVAAVAIVTAIAVRAGQDVDVTRLAWWPLPLALLAAVAWWLLLARGWAVLVAGRPAGDDVRVWCRTQTLRYLPGGVWAPASRVAVVRGGALDRLSTVAAENVIALCAALALGGVALAASGAPVWLTLILAPAIPALAGRALVGRTRLDPGRTRHATLTYLAAFAAYALAAVLVQAAVSGWDRPLAVAGGAAVAWAAGLVVVFAPGGVGVRELAYVGLLSGTLPAGELAAAAVTLRIVTIAAELAVLLVAGRPRLEAAVLRSALAPAAAFVRRHAVFLGLLAVGAALRVLVMVAYRPALLSYDSQGFLQNAAHLRPDPVRPLGYPVFLHVLDSVLGLAAVPAVQHLLGLAMAGLIYALLLRLGLPRWGAALAAAPVLLDAYQFDLEHYVLAETLFEALVLGGCAVLLWRRRPGLLAAGTAGLLLAGAALTRANGIVVLAPALVVVLATGWAAPTQARERVAGARARVARALAAGIRGLRPALPSAAALLAAFAVPVAAYGLWYQHSHGSIAITGYGKRFLYARVTPFVDCSKFSVPRDERVLCPIAPRGKRPTIAGSTVEFSMWHPGSPIWKVHVRVAGDFARRAIVGQPLDYLRTVAHDFLRGFAVIRTAQPGELPISRWQFPPRYPEYLPNTTELVRAHGGGHPAVEPGLARFLRGYQRFGFTPGPVLAVGVLAGLFAAAGVGRARRSGRRSEALLFAATGVAVFGSTVLTNQFSWRYALPMVVLLPPAAAVGLDALLRRGPSEAAARSPARESPQAVTGRADAVSREPDASPLLP